MNYISKNEIQQLKHGNWEHFAGQMTIKRSDDAEKITEDI